MRVIVRFCPLQANENPSLCVSAVPPNDVRLSPPLKDEWYIPSPSFSVIHSYILVFVIFFITIHHMNIEEKGSIVNNTKYK